MPLKLSKAPAKRPVGLRLTRKGETASVFEKPRVKKLTLSKKPPERIVKNTSDPVKNVTKASHTTGRDDEDNCLTSLSNLDDYTRVQIVTLPNGKEREWPVISVTALAEPLHSTAVTTNRWRNSGMLPEPIFETGRTLCYHLEELRSFVLILGEHFKTTKHYRASHEDTKKRLFAENARVRKSLLNFVV